MKVALEGLEGVVDELRSCVRRVEPVLLSGVEAVRLLKVFSEVERLAVAGRTLAARGVALSEVWKKSEHRSAAHYVAEASGVAVGQAVGTLETAERLEKLVDTASAFSSGELSEVRVREVAAAAEAAPEAEAELLDAARSKTVVELKETCRRVRASASDASEVYERIHRRRYLRHWTDTEGAFMLAGRMTVDDGARLLAGIEPFREEIFRQARKDGRREPAEAYAVDALVALAGAKESPRRGPRAMVHVRVDRSALVRGHTEPGEVSEIPGIGPIPVAEARRIASDAFIKALLSDAADITSVFHLGRMIPARLRTALEARDETCVVPGCDVRVGLEIDHIVGVGDQGETSLANCCRLCAFHHRQKTLHGWKISGSPGNWIWTGPDQAR